MNKCADCAHFRSLRNSKFHGDCLHPESGDLGDGTQILLPARIVRKGSCKENNWWQYDPGSPPEPEEMEDMG